MTESYVDIIESSIHNVYQNGITYADYLRNKYKSYKYICIFGAGNIGRPTAYEMVSHGVRVDFFCDNDEKKVGQIIVGVPCISLDYLCNIKDETMVIICGRAFDEIYIQLCALGFKHIDRLHVNKFRIRDYMQHIGEKKLQKNWCSLISLCADDESKRVCLRILAEWCNNESTCLRDIYTPDQYFCQEIVGLGNHEIVVDGGAYIGDTLKEYMKYYKEFDMYYMFEISEYSFAEMKAFVSTIDLEQRNKIVCINKGLSSRKGAVYYNEDDEGACISYENNGGIEGEVTSIDEECIESNITFIKLDIEGSELEALKGAVNCIRKYRPKLAICLYHKPEDMWEIPAFINRVAPDYKLYIRHHTDLMNETVCYAIRRQDEIIKID